MTICIIGSGYVGLVAAACFSEIGHTVVCVDRDRDRIMRLTSGDIPFYEPGLKHIVESNLENKKLHFSVDMDSAINDSDFIIVAVGTPQSGDGSADMSSVHDVFNRVLALSRSWSNPKMLILKSTVPVGTGDSLHSKSNHNIHVVNAPEFLREGQAVRDFLCPDRIVIGLDNDSFLRNKIFELYSHIDKNKICFVSRPSAELVKYGSNCMLATRITFMNELASLSSAYGGDVDDIADCIGKDSRIGKDFLQAGPGFGGSCFGKDLSAFSSSLKDRDLLNTVSSSVFAANQHYTIWPASIVKKCSKKTVIERVCVLGLAFKPNTDDVRDSPSLNTIKILLDDGFTVVCHDPKAMANFRSEFGDKNNLIYEHDMVVALAGADAIIIMTDWEHYECINKKFLSECKNGLKDSSNAVVVDPRRVLKKFRHEFYSYHGFGI